MRADDGAGALAIDVQIADVKFPLGHFNFFRRTGVNRAGQAKFSVVGDFESVLEVNPKNREAASEVRLIAL